MKGYLFVLRNIFFVISSIFILIFMGQILLFNNTKAPDSIWNIVVSLDVSKSMQVRDIENQSRLFAAKQYIYRLLSEYEGYNFWLTIFAGEAQRVLPLTKNTQLFATFVSWLDHQNITMQWSNISAALEDSLRNFSSDTAGAIILLTDGDEDRLELENSVKAKLSEVNAIVYIVWIGSKKGWYIPTWDFFTPYEMYNGQRVVARINTDGLQRLAKELSWKYIAYPNTLKLTENNIRKDLQKNIRAHTFLYLWVIFWILCCAMIAWEKYFPYPLKKYAKK